MSADRYEIDMHDDGAFIITNFNGHRFIVDANCVDIRSRAIRQQARDLDQLRADLAAAIARAEQADQRLGNLMAVIHRDGGHYESEHGTEKACADAELAVHVQRGIADGYHDALKIWRQRAEQAEARLAAIDEAPMVARVVEIKRDFASGPYRCLDYDSDKLPGGFVELIARPESEAK